MAIEATARSSDCQFCSVRFHKSAEPRYSPRKQARIAGEAEPGKVVVFARAERPVIVDGFVRESVDDLMLVARFRWVAGGDPSTVMPELLRAAALSP
jgi:hypothetical protein